MLAYKTASASLLLIATRLLTRFGDLITLLVLAYELKPADFGLVALAASLIFITEAVFELPLVEVVLRADVLERVQRRARRPRTRTAPRHAAAAGR